VQSQGRKTAKEEKAEGRGELKKGTHRLKKVGKIKMAPVQRHEEGTLQSKKGKKGPRTPESHRLRSCQGPIGGGSGREKCVGEQARTQQAASEEGEKKK